MNKFKSIMVESEVARQLEELDKGSYNKAIKFLLENSEVIESRIEIIEKRLDNLSSA